MQCTCASSGMAFACLMSLLRCGIGALLLALLPALANAAYDPQYPRGYSLEPPVHGCCAVVPHSARYSDAQQVLKLEDMLLIKLEPGQASCFMHLNQGRDKILEYSIQLDHPAPAAVAA